MPRFHRLAGAVALALACAGTAQAQQFSSMIVFGDSLSDSGNIAAAQGLPNGNSFTTNPDPVAVQIIAAAYGLPGGPSLAGGPNFAWGGACVNPVGPCLNPVPRIPTQIDQYLALTGGQAPVWIASGFTAGIVLALAGGLGLAVLAVKQAVAPPPDESDPLEPGP